MPLRQPHSYVIAHKIAVIVSWRLQPQRSEQKNLPRRRLQQIGPTHDFRDAHGGIVDNDGQLVGRHIVAPPNDKIAEVTPYHKPLWA